MDKAGFVDIERYSRGIEYVYGTEAKEANMCHALAKSESISDFTANIKPNEYVDRDLYGRGDVRVFGQDALIKLQSDAAIYWGEAQQRRKKKFNLEALVFPGGLKHTAKQNSGLVRCVSSVEEEKQEERDGERFATEDESKEDGVLSLTAQTIEHWTLENESSDISEESDSTLRSSMSKLPSEEARPRKKGILARLFKSLTSFSSRDRCGKRTDVVSTMVEHITEPPRVATYSSFAVRSTSRRKRSDADISTCSSKGYSSAEADERDVTDAIPNVKHDEAASGSFVGSDEELPFSSSIRHDAAPHMEDSCNSPSTRLEEELLARKVQEGRVLIDEAGRSGTGGNKTAGLFRSRETGSGCGSGNTSDSSTNYDTAVSGCDSEAPSYMEGTDATFEGVMKVGWDFLDSVAVDEDVEDGTDCMAAVGLVRCDEVGVDAVDRRDGEVNKMAEDIEEEGDRTFWQRLSVFGAAISNGWMLLFGWLY